ncbi:hypothetical protein CLOHYLEM_05965 [[Clostridium] hylemonae DSM 15053]|uniref:Uncharacterized protein n=1 Tax=[Clostridium] hylemonae DSM 15053 TaxID=553973 RepID=C0C1E6_9FIRM|nr:hypothetical protein CLOHYLEM_05965 [[Clostridium] hylemonae DSM 15053]
MKLRQPRKGRCQPERVFRTIRGLVYEYKTVRLWRAVFCGMKKRILIL